jgi:hypothetical protein
MALSIEKMALEELASKLDIAGTVNNMKIKKVPTGTYD